MCMFLALLQFGMATFYNVEFTIQETNCDNTTDLAEIAKCEVMTCEFAVSECLFFTFFCVLVVHYFLFGQMSNASFFFPQHKGLCRATHSHSPTGEEDITVECDIFEPEVNNP